MIMELDNVKVKHISAYNINTNVSFLRKSSVFYTYTICEFGVSHCFMVS